jgi:hypothetical protein
MLMGVLSRFKWNPALDSDCSGLYVDWWVCIGIQPQSVTASFEYITSAPAVVVPNKTADYTPTTFPAVDSSFTASPTQAGVATNCQAFYQAQSVSAFALSLSFLAPTAKICKQLTDLLLRRAILAVRYWHTIYQLRRNSSHGILP